MALNLNIYKRIKDLNAKTTLSDSDYLVSDNSSELASAKITFLNLCNQLLQKLKIGALSTSGHYINGESVAHDLNALDTQLHNTDGSISNKVSNVSYTDTGILQETINGTDSNVMVTDSTPTENSVNPIQSGAVYTAVQANTTAITNEATRAQQAEGANATAITNEKTRAQQAEGANAAALQAYKDLLGLTVDDEGYICQTI